MVLYWIFIVGFLVSFIFFRFFGIRNSFWIYFVLGSDKDLGLEVKELCKDIGLMYYFFIFLGGILRLERLFVLLWVIFYFWNVFMFLWGLL